MSKAYQLHSKALPTGSSTGDLAIMVPEKGFNKPAPVHTWDPPYCGEMDMVIRTDGTWFHEGRPICRPEMVRMFANIMKFESGRYYLVTPHEKIGIQVEDVPFIAVDIDIFEKEIFFLTALGDIVRLDAEHPLMLVGTPDAPRPYIEVRGKLRARIDRKSFYRLAVAARTGPDNKIGVWSAGCFFSLEF